MAKALAVFTKPGNDTPGVLLKQEVDLCAFSKL